MDATLNNRFGFDNDDASVNMEDDNEEFVENGGQVNRTELPEWSLELVQAAKDPIHLLRSVISEWGNFRNEMNRLSAHR